MTDIYLLSVPNRNIDYPALALPTLTGRLRKDGFSVEQNDINVIVKDRIITEQCLSALKKHVLPSLIAASIFDKGNQKYFIKLNEYIKTVDRQWGLSNIEKVKTLMQKREYEKILVDKEGFQVSLAIFKINRMLHNFVEYYSTHDELITNLFLECNMVDPIKSVVDETIEKILECNPHVLGLTVLEIQRSFALYFIKKIKKRYSGVVVVGGADPTRYEEKYIKYFDCIDFALLKEGEDSLPQLITQIKNGTRNFKNIKGIVYREDGEIVLQKPQPIDACRITAPDFDGIPLNKFLTATLPVHASRACYWALENAPQDPTLAEKRGCRFCAHYKTYSTYYERAASDVVDDMQMLHEKYGTNLFHLTDDALKINLGLSISKEIQKRSLSNLKWLVYARFEEGFTESVLNEWYKGGARVVEWGLESASQKVLDAMNKHVKKETAQRIILEASKVGILNKLFMFHNYPGETVADLEETLSFLYVNTKMGHIRPFPTVRNKMYLLKNTSLYNSLDTETLFQKVWRPSGEFSITAHYIDLCNYSDKVPLIENHLSQVKKLARDRFVFSTDDENVMFDLVVSDLRERGYCTYYGSK